MERLSATMSHSCLSRGTAESCHSCGPTPALWSCMILLSVALAGCSATPTTATPAAGKQTVVFNAPLTGASSGVLQYQFKLVSPPTGPPPYLPATYHTCSRMATYDYLFPASPPPPPPMPAPPPKGAYGFDFSNLTAGTIYTLEVQSQDTAGTWTSHGSATITPTAADTVWKFE